MIDDLDRDERAYRRAEHADMPPGSQLYSLRDPERVMPDREPVWDPHALGRLDSRGGHMPPAGR